MAVTALVPLCIFQRHPTGAGEMTQLAKCFLASMRSWVWFSETNEQQQRGQQRRAWWLQWRGKRYSDPAAHRPGSPVCLASSRAVRNTVSSKRRTAFLRNNTWGYPLDSNAHTLVCLLIDTHTHTHVHMYPQSPLTHKLIHKHSNKTDAL